MKREKKIRVVLGVTGSIAAYKAAELARYMMKRGCVVRVVMSKSAEQFISPLTFESLTGQPVARSFWEETQPGAIGHIALADWADIVLVAPATADTIAKVAYGFSDSPLLAVLLATKAPIVIAPAMNVNMFEHSQTQENIHNLQARGVMFVTPESGDLACGWKGRGRLAQPAEIYHHVRRAVSPQDLRGKRVVISTGPTREAIDPVRFISNRSSGKMGLSLAVEAFYRGAEVTLVHGPLSGSPKLPSLIRTISITSADEMRNAVINTLGRDPAQHAADIMIMAAAVADYRPETQSDQKIKKSNAPLNIQLVSNPDILKELGEIKGTHKKPFLVGFAVETGDTEKLLSEATRKLEAKNADLLVGNLAQDSFDKDTNKVLIVSKGGNAEEIDTARKSLIAKRIFNTIASNIRDSL
jgi:phosphopantothenoylcysteine decarboxylase/phosphopantothenate--cysteine ligase